VRALLDAAPVDASRVRAVVSEVIAGRGGDPAGVVARTGVPLLTDPPFSPAGVGLFAARALEALTPERPTRLLVAYGYPEGSPALGLKVQAELSRAAVAAVAERVVIVAHNAPKGCATRPSRHGCASSSRRATRSSSRRARGGGLRSPWWS
jgi:hypothetical protein